SSLQRFSEPIAGWIHRLTPGFPDAGSVPTCEKSLSPVAYRSTVATRGERRAAFLYTQGQRGGAAKCRWRSLGFGARAVLDCTPDGGFQATGTSSPSTRDGVRAGAADDGNCIC